tara:strand:- start:309 stop:548 length:240 start_codon:yes stop_codon:yes gene_type:complete
LINKRLVLYTEDLNNKTEIRLEETTKINITPNWQTVARIYTAVMENNDKTTKQGRAAVVNAREELIRMGALLDKLEGQK